MPPSISGSALATSWAQETCLGHTQNNYRKTPGGGTQVLVFKDPWVILMHSQG